MTDCTPKSQELAGGVEALLRRGDADAQGPAGLGPIGRDAGAAGVAAVVGVLDRIGHHRHARRAGQLDQPREHLALADALVVVAHQHEIDFVHAAGDAGEEQIDRRGGDGGDALAIDAHHLVRIAVLGPAEEPLLDGRGAVVDRMDFVSVHCPHTPGTYHLLSARRLKYLRPEAILINTARGEVVDENALVRMLEHGELASAGLDVFEHAPAVNDKLVALAKVDKVTLLPHMGSSTHEGRADMGEKVIVNIRTFVDGHRPPDRVLPSML